METSEVVLAPWVETRTERCRSGRWVTVAVNRRTQSAMFLDAEPGDDGSALREELRTGGYLAGHPVPPEAPRVSRVARFLRTFDAHWRDVDALVDTLYRRVGRHAWRRGALVGQVALAIAGVVAMVVVLRSGRPLDLELSVAQVPGYLGLSLFAVAVHEAGHAMVLARHGRGVSSLGFRLHLGSPAFYVESAEALLLSRRQRIVQAAAGTWAEWQVISLAAVVLAVAPGVPMADVLHRFLVFALITVAINLLPFAGLDGSFIVGDLVREPFMAIESRVAVVRWWDGDRRRGDGVLVAYAAANAFVSAALLGSAVVSWYLLFGGATAELASHGVGGWVAAAGLVVVSFGPSVVAVAPQLRRSLLVDRVWFRFERAWRVRAAERCASSEAFSSLGERALGVLAGQLRLHRVRRGVPLWEPGFSGFVVTDAPLELASADGVRRVDAGVHRIEGPGVSASVTRRRRGARVGLLPVEALAIVRRVEGDVRRWS